MKVISIAALAATGLLATSLCFADASEFVADSGTMPNATSGAAGTTPGNDMSNPDSSGLGSANSASNGAGSDNNGQTPAESGSDNGSGMGSDDMSADTATGDDDY